jgi:hypothetical protein
MINCVVLSSGEKYKGIAVLGLWNSIFGPRRIEEVEKRRVSLIFFLETGHYSFSWETV